MSNFIQHFTVSRAYKRLIYVVLAWSCICLVMFKMGSNGIPKSPFFTVELTESNGQQSVPIAVSVEDINAVRGLLQNDYALASTSSKEARDGVVVLPQSDLSAKAVQAFVTNLKSVDNNKVLNSASSLGNSISSTQTKNQVHVDKTFFDLRPLVDDSKSPNEQELLAQLAQYAYNAEHESIVQPKLEEPMMSELFYSASSTTSSASTTATEDQITNSNHNLPLSDWLKMRHLKFKMTSESGERCQLDYPPLYDLHFNNYYWQVLRGGAPLTPTNFYLYNAYYDNRVRGGPLANVRVLAMIDKVKPPNATCLLWYPQLKQPVITAATYTYAWYPKWGNYKDGMLQPYLINCRIPRVHMASGLLGAPSSVSLTVNRCSKITNNLRVIYAKPENGKADFAVCVKGLDFLHQDLSVRLVEWLELLRKLGAQKVFFYQLETHPNISKVLKHYSKEGFVQLTKLTLPGEQPNIPGFRHFYLKNRLTSKRQNELIPYNDCLYRNLNAFRYIALLDIDEVIMPRTHFNWSDLMKEVEMLAGKERNYTRASYNVRNVYFFDDLTSLNHSQGQGEEGIPSYMHMLSHVYRSGNFTKPGQYVKCFHNTERVVSLHNHYPLNCFGSCTTYSIDTNLAQLQHYRKDCVGPLRNACNSEYRAHTVRDTTIWKYKDELVEKVTHALKVLGFFAGQI